MMSLCICQSGKKFELCCGRFLEQGRLAKTPEQLMRSRYSAFALGGYGDYLLATWSEQYRHQYSAIDLSQKSTNWLGLEILSKSQKGDEGFVEFKASFLDDFGLVKVHHEQSRFERKEGRWLYLDGSFEVL